MKSFFLLLFLSLSLFSKDINSNNLCYEFPKEDFISTLEKQVDLLIDISFVNKKNEGNDEDKYMFLSLLTSKPIPYLSSSSSFYCMKNENKKNDYTYECAGDDDGGIMFIKIKEDNIFFNISHATMAQTPDDPVIHQVKSRNKTFSKGHKVDCSR